MWGFCEGCLEPALESTPVASEGKTIIEHDSYRNYNHVRIVVTRGMIDYRVVAEWSSLRAPLNSRNLTIWVNNGEVGKAYNAAFECALKDPRVGGYDWILTLEDDNIVRSDTLLRMFEHSDDYDVIGALYYTKNPENSVPVCWGYPGREDLEQRADCVNKERMANEITAQIMAKERDLRGLEAAISSWETDYLDQYNKLRKERDDLQASLKHCVMPVRVVPMGCTLFRKKIFEDPRLVKPWFETKEEFIRDEAGGKNINRYGQDVLLCLRLEKLGYRMGIDCSARIGHLSTKENRVY